jgi:hypothetical protein
MAYSTQRQNRFYRLSRIAIGEHINLVTAAATKWKQGFSSKIDFSINIFCKQQKLLVSYL